VTLPAANTHSWTSYLRVGCVIVAMVYQNEIETRGFYGFHVVVVFRPTGLAIVRADPLPESVKYKNPAVRKVEDQNEKKNRANKITSKGFVAATERKMYVN